MICLYQRWRISRALDDDNGSSSLPQRHMARCEACRSFYAKSLQLERLLRSEASGAGSNAGVGRSSPRRLRLAAAALAAGLLLAAAIAFALRDAPAPEREALAGPAEQPVERASLLALLGRDAADYALPAGRPLVREFEETRRQLGDLGRRMLSPLPVAWGDDGE